jgi:hypothetical protein
MLSRAFCMSAPTACWHEEQEHQHHEAGAGGSHEPVQAGTLL